MRGSGRGCHWNPCSSSFERQRAASGDRAAGNSLGATKPDPNGNLLPAATTDATTDRVFVTGSAIPTAQEVGPNPVLTATRELIQKSGERTAEQFLRNLPVANANGIPLSNNNNGSDTAIGGSGIALRAFDARATLVLVDGRRVAPYPITNSGISFVDLFSIPLAAIESVET